MVVSKGAPERVQGQGIDRLGVSGPEIDVPAFLLLHPIMSIGKTIAAVMSGAAVHPQLIAFRKRLRVPLHHLYQLIMEIVRIINPDSRIHAISGDQMWAESGTESGSAQIVVSNGAMSHKALTH